MKNKKDNKRKIIIPILLFLLLIGLRGTIAWLTSTDTIVNEFTIGEINSPTTDPDGNEITLTGNLYEKNWDASETHKVVPGATFAKEPYVGIGEDSEEAVVYIYVENDFDASNKVYFTLGEDWTAVTGHYTVGPETGTYTAGLFKYNDTLDASAGDIWTTALFTSIDVADDATSEDLTPSGATANITVKSLVHQAKDLNGDAIDAAEIEATAVSTLIGD